MPYLLRVLLAEDHCRMQGVVASLLLKTCALVGTVDRGDAVLEAVRQAQPDAVVLDISMPGRNGLELLSELREELPDLALVILTTYNLQGYREEAARRGVDGYVLKNTAATKLWPAVEAAVSVRRSYRPVRTASL